MTPHDRPRPVAVLLSAIAAVVFAVPTLFLPADTHTSVKAVFILVGSVLFVAAIVRMRSEIRRPSPPQK